MRNRIREVRKARGLSQEELAGRLGISHTHLGRWETGRRRVTLDQLEDVARQLNCSLADLLPDGGAPPPQLAEPELERYEAGADAGFEQRIIALLYPGRPHAMLYVVRGRALDLLGYLPGDLVLIDLGLKDAKAGDVVIAQLYDRESGEAETVLRLYQPPLLVTQSTDPAQRSFDQVGEHATIMGVVKHLIRHAE